MSRLTGSETKVSENGLFCEVHFDDPVKFLGAFVPPSAHGLFRRGDQYEWLFRGQSDADWGLQPKALRSNAFADIHFRRSAAVEPERRGLYDEEQVLAMFITFASQSGLAIPGDTQEWRDQRFAPELHDGYEFPPVAQRGAYALGQHYGIPTRLLDWSYNPLTSIYFACLERAKKSVTESRLVVVWRYGR